MSRKRPISRSWLPTNAPTESFKKLKKFLDPQKNYELRSTMPVILFPSASRWSGCILFLKGKSFGGIHGITHGDFTQNRNDSTPYTHVKRSDRALNSQIQRSLVQNLSWATVRLQMKNIKSWIGPIHCWASPGLQPDPTRFLFFLYVVSSW